MRRSCEFQLLDIAFSDTSRPHHRIQIDDRGAGSTRLQKVADLNLSFFNQTSKGSTHLSTRLFDGGALNLRIGGDKACSRRCELRPRYQAVLCDFASALVFDSHLVQRLTAFVEFGLPVVG